MKYHRILNWAAPAAIVLGLPLVASAALQPNASRTQQAGTQRERGPAAIVVHAGPPSTRVTYPEYGQQPIEYAPASPRVIDLAICLDTSGSMNDLIDAARQKIWAIVNDLALAEPQPVLRVALLSYGNDGHEASEGWVRIAQPLTQDLDQVSRELFALSTNGGTEYVGRVVGRATAALDWSSDAGALKIVVVAGNESALQDPELDARVASAAAIEQGIQVNTLYCGGAGDADAPEWHAVAMRADGFYAAIEPGQIVTIASPFDGRLAELSGELNTTYVPIGAEGASAIANQRMQDGNAIELNSHAAASRARTKAGKLYRNHWDLVDALDDGKVEWATLERDDLPEELRSLSDDELKERVEGCKQRRAELSSEIQTLSKQREEWLAAERQRLATDDSAGFDATVRSGVRELATAKGFRFPGDTPTAGETGAKETGAKETGARETGAQETGANGPGTGAERQGAPSSGSQTTGGQSGAPRSGALQSGSAQSNGAPAIGAGESGGSVRGGRAIGGQRRAGHSSVGQSNSDRASTGQADAAQEGTGRSSASRSKAGPARARLSNGRGTGRAPALPSRGSEQ